MENKKKLIKSVIIICLGLAVIFMTYQIIDRVKEKKEIAERIVSVPPFEFLALDSSLFSNQGLESGKPVIIAYVNPKCDDCEYQVSELIKAAEASPELQILLVSPEELAVLEKFYNEMNLVQYPQFRMLYDSKGEFGDIFDTITYPSLFIYSPDHELLKSYKGEVKSEAMITILHTL